MKFQCQESCAGKCCKIPEGQQLFIFLTGPDRMKLAAFLKKPINKFAQRSHFSTTRFGKAGWLWHLKQKNEPQCQFLSKTGRCTVYEARPTQCKTWPFWPENVGPETDKSNATFIKDIFMDECPGLGVGPEVPETEIQANLAEQRKADGLYANKKS